VAADRTVVVVLAGGRSTRYGSDKLVVLLDQVLAGLPRDMPLVCVGPPLPTPSRADVTWTRESSPYAGPLPAAAAGVAQAGADIETVVLVGGDMPHVGRAVPVLLTVLAAAKVSTDVAVLVDGDGQRQPLASAWHADALRRRLEQLAPLDGVPLRRLLDDAAILDVPDTWHASTDVDTP
jgi:molybdenum cofactor guanylyltransferase